MGTLHGERIHIPGEEEGRDGVGWESDEVSISGILFNIFRLKLVGN